MTEKEFVKIISIIQDVDSISENLSNLGVVICGNKIYQHTFFLTKYILEKEYSLEGLEWINWWLYDLPQLKKITPEKPHAYDELGEPIILDTINDLYNLLEKNYKNG